jgi:hypothetical protein
MDLTTTLIVLAASVGVFAYGSWVAARPADPLNPRLIPWRPIIIFAGVAAILMLVHVVNLLGVETGGQQPGMRPFP